MINFSGTIKGKVIALVKTSQVPFHLRPREPRRNFLSLVSRSKKISYGHDPANRPIRLVGFFEAAMLNFYFRKKFYQTSSPGVIFRVERNESLNITPGFPRIYYQQL